MDSAKKEKLLSYCRWFEVPRDYEYPFIKVSVSYITNHGVGSRDDYSYVINQYTDGRYFKYLSDYVKSIMDYYDSQERVDEFDIRIFNDNRVWNI